MFIPSSSFCITKDNKFISSGWQNDIYIYNYPPLILDKKSLINVFGDSNINNKIHCIYDDTGNNLWVGTDAGLCKITNEKKTYFHENEILSSAVKTITQDRNNHIWFAGDKGISSYRLSDSLITNYSYFDDYDLSASNTLSVDKYNRLWIGTMNGLYILEKIQSEF
ncbi:MAG: hypothetical protein IPJ45_17520 [Ignavibacteria bacterium]|nr:hypothetical protein [Ignavibacteria bacterium]